MALIVRRAVEAAEAPLASVFSTRPITVALVCFDLLTAACCIERSTEKYRRCVPHQPPFSIFLLYVCAMYASCRACVSFLNA